MNRYKLNTKLLVILLVVCIVCGVGVYFVWAAQVSRNAGSHLERAKEAIESGDSRGALLPYHTYLSFVPEDEEARAEYALTLMKVAERADATMEDRGRVMGILPETIRRIPDNDEVREQFVEFTMSPNARQYADAQRHLEHLIKKHPDNSEYKAKMLKCLVRSGAFDGEKGAIAYGYGLIGYDLATATFDKEKATAADQPLAYSLMANLVRQHRDDKEQARRIIEEMVAANPESFESYLMRGTYFLTSADEEEKARAIADIAKAYELNPTDLDVLASAVRVAIMDKDMEKAKELVAIGMKEHPDEPYFYQLGADIATSEQDTKAAIKIIDEGIAAAARPQLLILQKAQIQLQDNDPAAIRATKKSMESAGFTSHFIEFVEGQALFAEGKWAAAVQKFDAAQPLLVGQPIAGKKVDLFIGQCRENLGQWELAAQAYDRAFDFNPDQPYLRTRAEQMRSRLGRQRPGSGQSLESLIAAEQAKPESERDWSRIDAMIEDVIDKNELDEERQAVLRVQTRAMRGDFSLARDLVKKITEDEPSENIPDWLMAMNLTASDPERGARSALEIVEKATQKFGDLSQFRLQKLAYLLNLGGDDLIDNLGKLTAGIEDWSTEDKIKIRSAVADAYVQLREAKLAEDEWAAIIEAAPQDLATRVRMFNIARGRRNDEMMKAAQDEILKVVGSKTNPTYRFAEAARLITLVQTGEKDKSALKDAANQIGEALKERPEWHELYRLRAELALVDNRPTDAINDYDRAAELGPSTAQSVIIHAQLLYNLGRFAEARRVAESISKPARQQWLGRLNAEIMMNTNNTVEALETAEKVVEASPNDPSLRLWYGQLLLRASGEGDKDQRIAKAEEAIKKAVELGPGLYGPWQAWIRFLVATDRKAEAEEAVRQAQLALPSDVLPIVMAECSKLLGRWLDAEGYYLTAVNAEPEDTGRARLIGDFYMSRMYPREDRVEKATPYINQILRAADEGKVPSDNDNVLWARRETAKILSASQDYQQLLEAEKMLEANAVDGDLRVEDKLLLAGILAPRPEPESRRKAIQLLEDVKRAGLSMNVAAGLSLAQLYQKVGDWTSARNQMLDVVGANENDPKVWETFVRMLIEHGDFDEADTRLRRLVALQPKASGTLEMQVRVLAGQGKKRQAIRLLRDLLPKSRNELTVEQLPLIAGIANLLVQVDSPEDAEKLYQLHYVISQEADKKEAEENDGKVENPKSIQSAVLYANHQGLHGDTDEAFKILQPMWEKTKSPQILQIALVIIRERRDDIGDRYDEMIENWLTTSLRDDPESVQLLLAEAEFRDIQENYAAAEEIYRRLLAKSSLNTRSRGVILNNAAFLLAIQRKNLDDAKNWVEEATRLFGPTADLLDTRGVVRIALNDGDGAVEDLELSVSDNPTPAKYFHLAQAYLLKQDLRQAIKSWDAGIELGLEPDSLNRLERSRFEAVSREIDNARSGGRRT